MSEQPIFAYPRDTMGGAEPTERDEAVAELARVMMEAAHLEGRREPYVLANAIALMIAMGIKRAPDQAQFRGYFEECFRQNCDAMQLPMGAMQ